MFYLYSGALEGSEIVAIYPDSGRVAWSRPLNPIEWSVRGLAIWDELLLCATTTELNAYTSNWGAMLWSTHLGSGHVSVVLQADQELARIYYGDRLIEVLPSDGSISREVPLGSVLWIEGPYVIRQSTDDDRMWATSAVTGELLWQSSETAFRREEWHPPVSSDSSHLLVRLSEGSICSLSLQTGRYTWCTDTRFVSNVAVDEDANIAYALTDKFVLQALDPSNGHVLQSIQFFPSVLPDDFAHRGFWYSVAASREYISVMFGDSWQLFGVNAAGSHPPR